MPHAKKPFKRADRVADVVRRVLSEAIVKKFPHHGLDGMTVTAVRMTDDLQNARIYYRVLDVGRKTAVAEAIEKVGWMLRKEVGRELHTRYTPHLAFEYDESLDYGERMDRIFDSLHPEEE